MHFKNTIEALGRTPLVELARLSPKKDVHIYTKLERLAYTIPKQIRLQLLQIEIGC